ncbi:MAG: LPS assembly protein LptD, partial [Desulfobacteraceae bacterium]
YTASCTDSGICQVQGIILLRKLQVPVANIEANRDINAHRNFYIKGETIKKTGKKTYQADRASVTSCPGENPDWKISGRDIKVTLEGYGTLNHATLWARKAPVFYSPFLAFPVKTRRETGLLTPVVTSSDRKGVEYEQPLFLALGRSSDATLYADYMEKRGIKAGLEYRYILSRDSRGTFFYDFLHDRQTGENSPGNDDYNVTATPDRTNTRRYWFRMKHDQTFSNDWALTLDLDYVSDADYLREFQEGYTGLDKTRAYFEDQFGRSLDDYDETIRENKLNLNRTWSVYSLNMALDWQDNVLARQNDEEDTTLQSLPAISFNRSKQQAGPLPLYYDLDTRFDYFYRQDTRKSLVRGSRTDLAPRVYLPLNFNGFLAFEPSLGIRETLWYSDEFHDTPGAERTFHHREIYDIDLELSSAVSRVFTLNSRFAEKIKHDIEPAIIYSYIPKTDQDELPEFDGIDRIERENRVTWEVTNRFTAKTRTSGKSAESADYTYNNFARVKLYQSFDINKEKYHMDEPFSDISFEGEVSLGPFLFLEENFDWSPYDNSFTSSETGVSLKNRRGDALHGEYRYQRSTSESLYARLDAALTRNITAYTSFEKDLLAEKRIETQTGVVFKRSCWTLSLAFTDEIDENALSFMLTLHGIGGFGTL